MSGFDSIRLRLLRSNLDTEYELSATLQSYNTFIIACQKSGLTSQRRSGNDLLFCLHFSNEDRRTRLVRAGLL
jgi:hypothetical protein